MDENGEHVFVNLAERNMLLGGEPGAGKSSGINLIVAHGALSCDCKLILVDGKRVELGPWRDCADLFIGPSIKAATEAFEAFQKTMDERYDKLLADGRPRSPAPAGSRSTSSSSTSMPTSRPRSAPRPSGRSSPPSPVTS
jgi:S-DNA-T family DNA segregation ATPase FtsK/SpoIIIE